MNVKKITNKLLLWKSTEDFYSYKELKELSEHYFNNTVRIVFLTESGMLFNADFKVYDKHIDTDIYMIFSKDKSQKVYEEEYCNESFTNYRFKEKIKEEYFKQTAWHSSFIKYCLMSDLYTYITDSISQ